MPSPSSPAPILLLQADFCGTLAATRSLGLRGVPVTIADGNRLAPARWSRFATRKLDGPDLREPESILAFLRAFGAREPRHVLYPTSDDLAWLVALHAGELSRWFDLFTPPIQTLETLLDKRSLHAAAEAVGLSTPATWYPGTEEEAARLAPTLSYPLLVKPRTQIFSTRSKGAKAETWVEFLEALRTVHATARYPSAVRERLPEATMPMLQAFEPGASEAIFTVSGFCGPGGSAFCALASRKILQRPRKLGVGVCFEAAPLDPGLASQLQALCARTGYQGAFDIEFLEAGGRKLLIDFNPRFYNQMAFEIDRGIPTPWLVWLGATGDRPALERAVAEFHAAPVNSGAIYCDHVAAMHLMFWRLFAGRTGRQEEAALRRWYNEHQQALTEPLDHKSDHGPRVAAMLAGLRDTLRHPRAYLRKTVLDR